MNSADRANKELNTLVRLKSISTGAGIREAIIEVWMSPFYVLVQFCCYPAKHFKPRAFHT